MSKQEFLDQLSQCLEDRVDSREIADTINYYRDYFTQEMNSGKSEEEVAASLGSPRLIAHSIVDAHEEAENGEPTGGFYDASDDKYEDYTEQYTQQYTISPVKAWAIKIGIVVFLVVLLVLAFMLLRVLFPVILIAIIVGWIYRTFFGRY